MRSQVVIGKVGQRFRADIDQGAQCAFGHTVDYADLVVGAEIPFADVGEHVHNAAGSGERRHRDAEFGVHERECRPEYWFAQRELGMLMLIVDDGDLAGFAARCRARQYHRDGKGAIYRHFAGEIIPYVTLSGGSQRDCLGRIDDAASADGHNGVDIAGFGDGDAFTHQRQSGIRLHAAKLRIGNAGPSKAAAHGI